MKSYHLSILASLIVSGTIVAQSGETITKKMHDRYGGKWYKTFTFVQTTEFYRNDTLNNKQTWYEAIRFPDAMRIDFGDIKNGNSVIFRGDSSYNFRGGKLVSSSFGKNDLQFILGGMYFLKWDDVKRSFSDFKYDLSKGTTLQWKGKEVYVIGAKEENEKVNQLWIDKEKLVIVRMIKYDGGRKQDGIFEDHQKIGDIWTEMKVTFYINDKLYQVEYYGEPKANPVLDERIFNPFEFGKIHWRQ